MRRLTALQATLYGGLLAGLFDITYAVVYSGYRGVAAQRVLQSVASGLLGKDAYEGGVPSAVLGLVLHFLIAVAAAGLFVAVSRKVDFLVRQWILSGLVFGLGVYLTMKLVVLPLSAFPGKIGFPTPTLYFDLVVHMVFFGLSVAWFARRAAR